MDQDKMSKIPYMILQFDKDGNAIHEESHNMENIYLDPYGIEGIARSILPDIQAYYDTAEGQAEFEKWQAEQAALGIRKPAAKGKKHRRKHHDYKL